MVRYELALILFLLLGEAAYACNIERFSFGSTANSVETHITAPSVMGEGPFGKHEKLIPAEEICKNEKLLLGVPITFIFLYDKLVQIQMQDIGNMTNILEWAEKKYGVIQEKPENFYSPKKNAQFIWDKPTKTVFYSVGMMGTDMVEYLEITSNSHGDLFEKRAKAISDQEEKNSEARKQ